MMLITCNVICINFTGKSESEAQLSPASDIITKEIPESSEEGKKCSGTASSSSLTNIQSKNAVIKTEVSSSLPVKNAISTPSLKDSTVDPSKPDVKKESTSIDTVAKEVVEKPVFKLGQEGNYSSYVNQFTSNTLALNKQQQVDQRDKKRSVSHKFSLNEFKWHGDTCGSKEVILNTLRFSIVGVENSIPSAFMHPSWPVQRSTWVKAVHMSKTPKEFAAALSFLESSIRPICYLSVWNDAVGHVELRRVMSESRQAGIKKKDHREEEEEPELDPKGFGKWYFCYSVELLMIFVPIHCHQSLLWLSPYYFFSILLKGLGHAVLGNFVLFC